jgi:hypothetical protein
VSCNVFGQLANRCNLMVGGCMLRGTDDCLCSVEEEMYRGELFVCGGGMFREMVNSS